MPHSISPEASAIEESILPDFSADPLLENAISENSSDESAGIATNRSAYPLKPNVTLKPEDLFMTDDEDDEDYPMSSAPGGDRKVEGSSPPAVFM